MISKLMLEKAHAAMTNEIHNSRILKKVIADSIKNANDGVPTDSEVINTIKKQLIATQNKLDKTHARFPNKIEMLEYEQSKLLTYLPDQLNADNLLNILQDFSVEFAGYSSSRGMKFLNENYNGQYDIKQAFNIACDLEW